MIVETHRLGTSSISRLAALCLWSVGLRHPPAKVYQGPTGERPLAYISRVLKELSKDARRESFQLPMQNVRPTQIQEEFNRVRQRGTASDQETIRTLLDHTRTNSPPGKERAADQQHVLSFAAARADLPSCEICIDYLLETFGYMGAWRKLEYRAADVVAALWQKRVEWQPLLYRFASELLMRKAAQGQKSETFDFWTQVQATCGVGVAIANFSTEERLSELQWFVDTWSAEVHPARRWWQFWR